MELFGMATTPTGHDCAVAPDGKKAMLANAKTVRSNGRTRRYFMAI
jgi:hypothetical protein